MPIFSASDYGSPVKLHLDFSKIDRTTALRTWLVYHEVELKELALQMGVHPGTISRIINGKRSPENLLRRLNAYGIPKELLPEPGPGPGRPKKTKNVFLDE